VEAVQVEVLRYLITEDFKFVSRRKNVLHLRGPLRCRQASVQIDLWIEDWDFVRYPVIKIRDRPEKLAGVQAHLSAGGGLCYLAPGAVLLDRFDPVASVVQCLAQAAHVVDKLALDPSYRRAEFTREYLSQWSVGQSPSPRLVLKAGVDKGATNASMAILDDHWLICGQSHNELELIAQAMARPLNPLSAWTAWVFDTEAWPPLTEKFPENIHEWFAWLNAWDPLLHRAISERLVADRDYLKWSILHTLVRSPAGWLGIQLPLGDANERKTAKADRRSYVHRLHRRGKHLPITRLEVSDWSAEFVHSRNLTFPDLTDRRVTLIGCGAIGSHLAEALVRLGAGQGKKGHLMILDPDLMLPENLGRHALGYRSLMSEKAVAMADELCRDFPLARVTGVAMDALKSANLFKADLVIDATGEEALSEAINDRQRRAAGSACPVLYVRIFGQGEAVQSLWVDPVGKGGCFRCLRTNDPQSQRAERFPISDHVGPRSVMKGCRAITPYAVSAPMHAAALAADAIADWLSGKVSPTFRTLARPGANLRKVKDQNLTRLPKCPACDPAARMKAVA